MNPRLVLGAALLVAGLGTGTAFTVDATPESQPATDAEGAPRANPACGLLTIDEINRVLGTPVTGGRGDDGQCTYQLADGRFGVLSVTLIDGGIEARTFGPLLAAYAANLPSPAEPVAGVGDEAYAIVLSRTAQLQIRIAERALTLMVMNVTDDHDRMVEMLSELGAIATARLA